MSVLNRAPRSLSFEPPGIIQITLTTTAANRAMKMSENEVREETQWSIFILMNAAREM